MQENFIPDQITGYCKTIGCKGLCGTFRQTERGLSIIVHSSTPPPKDRFTSIKENANGAYLCFISNEDIYNKEVTAAIPPFVHVLEDTKDYW